MMEVNMQGKDQIALPEKDRRFLWKRKEDMCHETKKHIAFVPA